MYMMAAQASQLVSRTPQEEAGDLPEFPLITELWRPCNNLTFASIAICLFVANVFLGRNMWNTCVAFAW